MNKKEEKEMIAIEDIPEDVIKMINEIEEKEVIYLKNVFNKNH